MAIFKFFQKLTKDLSLFEVKVKDSSYGLSRNELSNILRHARSENVKFLGKLVDIHCLSAVEIGFLLAKIELDNEKIETIKKAAETYNEKDFVQHGQTFTDFMFRVCVNLDMLNCSNIEMFKELTNCKNEIYDFANAVKAPLKSRQRKRDKSAYAFERVYIEK